MGKEPKRSKHDDHGKESAPGDGPSEPDCACRATEEQEECAEAGCGFCKAAQARHCDNYPTNILKPECLRWFIFVHRLPAVLKALVVKRIGEPKLFADYNGIRVRVTMASRLGDVGITKQLDAEAGYETRVPVDFLNNFSESPSNEVGDPATIRLDPAVEAAKRVIGAKMPPEVNDDVITMAVVILRLAGFRIQDQTGEGHPNTTQEKT